MKTLNHAIGRLTIGIMLAFCASTFAQLQFTDVHSLPDEGIQLYWASESNTVYRIEYAAELVDGGTSWGVLYDDYPSHGTNTFLMDTGNYDQIPWILRPKDEPMRFYRVVNKGTNSGAAPFVSITSPTNGAVLSGEIIISVVSTSGYPVVNNTLFIDGQQMDSSEDGTNYVINTCEWPNGQHVFFATAMAESGLTGETGVGSTDVGRAVSAYVTVNFDNLIHKVDFSEPFFEPSLGQTQRVTAAFAANVDWTLQMMDDSSNAVRTVTGSGISLEYDWDGTGEGGTNLPDGIYFYVISAQTNGQAFSMMSASGSSSFAENFVQLWALSPESSGPPVPLALYPPGFDTSTFEIFEASQSEIRVLTEAVLSLDQPVKAAKLESESGGGGGAAAAYSGPSGQSTASPTKPPTKRVKNAVGTVGVAYYDWSTPRTIAVPPNGLGLPGNSGKIQIRGSYGNRQIPTLPGKAALATKFASKMAKAGYKLSFNRSGTNLPASSLKKSSLGGSAIFSTVNIGYFSDHGEYGTTIDWHSWASQSLQTYFPSDHPSDSSNPWIGFSEFGFGGGSLRWMAFDTCFNLRGDQFNSMKNKGVLPLASDNHLICGATTVTYAVQDLGELWASKMIGGTFTSPETVSEAWFDAGVKAYGRYSSLSNVVFRVIGWDDCFDDKLKDFVSSPGGDLDFRVRQVYPSP
jgi:hypothetical protein